MTTTKKTTKRIVFHVGGPAFHPVDRQATAIAGWLGDGYRCEQYDGLAAFEQLEEADLFVLMGLHWTGMTADWAGKLTYRPMEPRHVEAFERYVRSGRPVLAHHGAVASYDDVPRFGELVGVRWVWGKTTHSPVGDHTVRVLSTGHPVVRGVSDYTLHDELYYDLEIDPKIKPVTHAEADWDGKPRPMVVTAESGRVEGAGRLVYLANGHDMKAFEAPAMAALWRNAVRWLVED